MKKENRRFSELMKKLEKGQLTTQEELEFCQLSRKGAGFKKSSLHTIAGSYGSRQ